MQSSSRNGAKVIWLAVHTTEGIMRAVDLRAWASWPGSSHASNDETGVLLSGSEDGFVDYDRAAWTLRNGNPVSDNLEQCGWARWTRAEWLSRPKLLETTALWLAQRHKARPWIPLRHLSPTEVGNRIPGVIGHVDYTRGTADGTHTDPGPNYPWDVVIARAKQLADPTPEDEVTDADIQKIVAALRSADFSPAAGTQSLQNMVSQIHSQLTSEKPSFVEGSDYEGDLDNFVRWCHYHLETLRKEDVPAMRKQIDALRAEIAALKA